MRFVKTEKKNYGNLNRIDKYIFIMINETFGMSTKMFKI